MKYFLPVCIIIVALFSACKKESPPLDQPVGKITYVEGTALVNALSAMADQNLFLNDTIETKAGKIKIAFNDESTIALSENSKIIINEFTIDAGNNFRKTNINMPMGQLRSVVSKHFTGAGSEVNIETPTAIAGVRGTELAITADEKQSSVYCLDGHVEVFKPLERDKKAYLTKNMFVSAVPDKPIEEPRSIPPELLKTFVETTDFLPPDLKNKSKIFEETFEAKKAEMKQKEREVKRKMEDKKEQVKEKMKDTEQKFQQKQDDQRSEMDKKRDDMLRKMKEKMKH